MNIKDLRTENGYTQKALAKAIGVAESTVCCWEIGKRTPGLKTLQKLAELFNCTIDDLLSQKAV